MKNTQTRNGNKLLIPSLRTQNSALPTLCCRSSPVLREPDRSPDISCAKTTISRSKKTSPYNPNFDQTSSIIPSIHPDNYNFPRRRDPPRSNNENEILDRITIAEAHISLSQHLNFLRRHFVASSRNFY